MINFLIFSIKFPDNVASVHCGRSLSCVCRCVPQVSLGHQHASGVNENGDERDGGINNNNCDDNENGEEFPRFISSNGKSSVYASLHSRSASRSQQT